MLEKGPDYLSSIERPDQLKISLDVLVLALDVLFMGYNAFDFDAVESFKNIMTDHSVTQRGWGVGSDWCASIVLAKYGHGTTFVTLEFINEFMNWGFKDSPLFSVPTFSKHGIAKGVPHVPNSLPSKLRMLNNL